MMRGFGLWSGGGIGDGDFCGRGAGDSLSIVYSVSQNQTVDVQDGAFTVVTFTGSVVTIRARRLRFS